MDKIFLLETRNMFLIPNCSQIFVPRNWNKYFPDLKGRVLSRNSQILKEVTIAKICYEFNQMKYYKIWSSNTLLQKH